MLIDEPLQLFFSFDYSLSKTHKLVEPIT